MQNELVASSDKKSQPMGVKLRKHFRPVRVSTNHRKSLVRGDTHQGLKNGATQYLKTVIPET